MKKEINFLAFPATATQVATWVDGLAQQVIPEQDFKSFAALPLRSRVLGVAVFAHIGGEKRITNQCLALLRGALVALLLFVPAVIHAQQPCSTDTDCARKNGGDGSPTPAEAPKAAIYCGAPTKAGKPCRRRVKVAGSHCYMHRG